MSDALPAPLTPADCDLTDFGFMPLDVRRLRDSRFAASSSGDEFRTAVLLWCAAWHQKPAASLPDDDVELSQLAGYGRVVREWKKVRAGALHGWIKATDGRLYHRLIAEKAIEAWNGKREHAWIRECDRTRKENKKRVAEGKTLLELPDKPRRISAGTFDGIPTPEADDSAGIPTESGLKGEGQGEGKEEDLGLRPAASSVDLFAEPSPDSSVAPDARTVLWSQGLPILRQLTGKPDGAARSLLGKLLQLARDDCAGVLATLREAADARPVDPVAWLTAAAKSRGSPHLAVVRSDLPTLPAALDPPDAWGIRPWIMKQPDVSVTNGPDGCDGYAIGGWNVEDVALAVMNAAGVPVESRLNLDALGAWLRDDVPVMSPAVLDAIRRVAVRHDGPMRSLGFFDGSVRDAARRAAV